jgi:hypothetical protein
MSVTSDVQYRNFKARAVRSESLSLNSPTVLARMPSHSPKIVKKTDSVTAKIPVYQDQCHSLH